MDEQLDVLIIGAGQTGLAAGYYLRQSGLSFLLADRHSRIGDSWRNRYDSLMLFTPRVYSSLPGLGMPGDPDGYAGRDEFAEYLEAYAQHFDLPVSLNTSIERLFMHDDHFGADLLDGRTFTARVAIIATGGYQQPVVPSFAKDIPGEVAQFTVDNYRRASQVPGRTVVVVGDGATGRDIAAELSSTHSVVLSTGKQRRIFPQRVLTLSTWRLMDRLGILTVDIESPIGRRLQASDSFPNREKDFPSLKRRGIQIMPRLMKVEGSTAVFQNGDRIRVDTIIWAVGYQDFTKWVGIPAAKDEQEKFVHRRGISPVPNLYYLGRPWQSNLGSARIYGVSKDAEAITRTIMNHFADGKLRG
jgi:putative flavoprotein involved in K+ transport